MKKLNLKTIFVVLAAALSLLFVSCSDEDSATSGSGAPSITSISLAQNDSLVEQGFADNMYIIRGKGFTGIQKVYFNETDTYFNPTFVTDVAIIISIDRSTPYENVNNELKVVTATGTAVYSFVVAPPAPAIASINPVNASTGETITIKGSYFLEPVVTFGDIPATILSSSFTEIQVQVPEGAQFKHINVTTISGEDTSWEAIGTSLFDDAWYSGWGDEGTGVSYVTGDARQGDVYFKVENGAWSGNQFREANWATVDIANYTGLRFSIKGETEGRIAVIINGNWNDSDAIIVDVTTEWQDIEIPFTDFPFAVTGLQTFVIKEFTGTASVYNVDNLGFTVSGD